MTKEETKYKDATELKAYLLSMDYLSRIEYVSLVIEQCREHNPHIRRSTFFNWKNMSAVMPRWAKECMESVAGQTIFSPYALGEA